MVEVMQFNDWYCDGFQCRLETAGGKTDFFKGGKELRAKRALGSENASGASIMKSITL